MNADSLPHSRIDFAPDRGGGSGIRIMFGFTPEAAVVQVHGVGPFHIHWRAGTEWRDKLKTLDDADAGSVFKFKRGERVVTKRGKGRIRQGYDSGEVIGYEIDGDDGTLFMAMEDELTPLPLEKERVPHVHSP